MCRMCEEKFNYMDIDECATFVIFPDGRVYVDPYSFEMGEFGASYGHPDEDAEWILTDFETKKEWRDYNGGNDGLESKDVKMTYFNYCPYCGRKF